MDVYDPDVICFLEKRTVAEIGAYRYCLACQKNLAKTPSLRRADKEKCMLRKR